MGSIEVRASEGLLTAVKAVSWDRQTTHSVEWLNQNLALALANLPEHMGRLLGDASGESAREQALARAPVGVLWCLEPAQRDRCHPNDIAERHLLGLVMSRGATSILGMMPTMVVTASRCED